MATSAPSSRHSATFSSVPAVANTFAPACLASWIAADPDPPAAAWINTLSPACSSARSKRPSHARWNGKYSAAASGSGIASGISNAETTGQIAYSANPPCAPFGIATTRLPSHVPAPSPHASTMPITSMPGLYGSSGRTIMLPPVMRSRSFRFSGIACTRTRTSPASGLGIGTSSSTSAVRGGPYSCVRHARIVWSLSTSLTLPQPAARSHLTTVGASLALPAVCLAASTVGPRTDCGSGSA